MEESVRRIAGRFRIGPEELQALALRVAGRDRSLSRPSGSRGGGDRTPTDWLERLPDMHPSPEEQVAAIHDGRFWRERLVRALAALPARSEEPTSELQSLM